MKKKKKTRRQSIPKHLRGIHGIELVDLESFHLQISPFAGEATLTSTFAGDVFILSFSEGKVKAELCRPLAVGYLGRIIASAELSALGWNRDTKKPQIAWKGKPHRDLVRATDVIVAVMFGMIHPYDPSQIAPMLKPKKKKVRK